MKVLALAAALVALTPAALAGAALEPRPHAVIDTTTATMLADASRLGSASVTALNGSRWSADAPQGDGAAQFGGVEVETSTLLIGAGVLAFLLSRPLSSALRRQAQHRRAIALASTLHHTPRA